MHLSRICLLVLVVFFAAIPFTSFAQKNFQPGYYLNLRGDTVRGQVDDRRWSGSPQKINFRQNGENQTISLDEMLGFGIDGDDQYVRRVVSRSTRPVDVVKLKHPFTDSNITAPLLLRRVVDGRWSLYYANVEKPLFFLQVGKDSLEELQYIVRDYGEYARFSEHFIFRRQIQDKRIAAGADSLMPILLERLAYNEKELAKYIRSLNGSTSDTIRTRRVVRFFIGAGVASNKLRMEGKFAINIKDMNARSTFSPVIQAGVDVSELRNLQRFMFRVELTAFQFNVHHTGNYWYALTGTDTHIDYELNMLNIQPSMSLMYHFLVFKKQKFYAGGALGSNFTSYQKNKMKVTGPYPNASATAEPAFDFRRNWTQVFARAGWIQSDRFELGLRYSLFGTFAWNTAQQFKPRNLLLQCNYRF